MNKSVILLNDVFCRLLISSDPMISSIRKTPPKESRSLSSEALKMLLPPEYQRCSGEDVIPNPDDDEDVELFDVENVLQHLFI